VTINTYNISFVTNLYRHALHPNDWCYIPLQTCFTFQWLMLHTFTDTLYIPMIDVCDSNDSIRTKTCSKPARLILQIVINTPTPVCSSREAGFLAILLSRWWKFISRAWLFSQADYLSISQLSPLGKAWRCTC